MIRPNSCDRGWNVPQAAVPPPAIAGMRRLQALTSPF
jgi:hypothetical protein